MSISYAFQPHLRPRLTQGGRTFPWKPWAFDGRDSHPSSRYLHRHSHFYVVQMSSRSSFVQHRTLPYQLRYSRNSAASVVCLAPVHFRRSVTRLVSYYALFYILLHLAYILGPYLAVWTVFLLTMNFLAHKSDCYTAFVNIRSLIDLSIPRWNHQPFSALPSTKLFV